MGTNGTNGADARFGPWGEPFAAITYGESGVGKSLDAYKAIGFWSVVLCMPGGAKPALAVCGFRPRVQEIRDLDEGLAFFAYLGKLPPQERPLGVIWDDYTLQIEATATKLLTVYGDSDGRMKGDNSFRYYGAIKARIDATVAASVWCGVHVVANGHMAKPEDFDGQRLKGGPKVVPRKAVNAIPHAFHTVLRAGVDPQTAMAERARSSGATISVGGGAPALEERALWKGVYHCQFNADYHEKDRHDVFRAQSPMNLGEGLRLAGYLLPRPRGLEWMDADVEAISQVLAANPDKGRAVLRQARDVLQQKHPDYLVQWTLQDARDRYELRRDRYSALRAL